MDDVADELGDAQPDEDMPPLELVNNDSVKSLSRQNSTATDTSRQEKAAMIVSNVQGDDEDIKVVQVGEAPRAWKDPTVKQP